MITLKHLSSFVGWQYNVIHSGSVVVKIPKTLEQIRSAITSRPWGQRLPPDRVVTLSEEVSVSARQSIHELKVCPSAHRLCGNPRFLPFNIIIQDAGESFLNLILKKHISFLDPVRHFFSLSQKLWMLGLFETTFDFLRNYGLSRKGEPFFIDLGGFIADEARAGAYLQKEYWKERHDYLSLDPATRRCFDDSASEILTLKCLHQYWGRATTTSHA